MACDEVAWDEPLGTEGGADAVVVGAGVPRAAGVVAVGEEASFASRFFKDSFFSRGSRCIGSLSFITATGLLLEAKGSGLRGEETAGA